MSGMVHRIEVADHELRSRGEHGNPWSLRKDIPSVLCRVAFKGGGVHWELHVVIKYNDWCVHVALIVIKLCML